MVICAITKKSLELLPSGGDGTTICSAFSMCGCFVAKGETQVYINGRVLLRLCITDDCIENSGSHGV
jgi:hypothetical protein